MTELSRRARDLITRVDDRDGPSGAERARLRARVLARVGAGLAAGGAVAATSTGAEAAAGGAVASTSAVVANAAVKGSVLGLVIKAIAVVAVVGAAGAGATAFVKATSNGPSSRASSTRPVAPAAPSTPSKPPAPLRLPEARASVSPAAAPGPEARSPAPPVDPATAPRASVPAAAAPSIAHTSEPRAPVVSAVAPPAPPPEGIDAETHDLAVALAALRDGRLLEALSDLDDQDARYPTGALGEERGASRIDALCALGRIAEARSATARFLSSYPRSLFAPRVNASCGVESSRP